MAGTLEFSHEYPVDADRLFRLVADLDALDMVNRPIVQFDHLPSGQVREGQVIDVAVSVFGLLPGQPYRMHVTTCDPLSRHIRSLEDGMGVRELIHDLTVEPVPGGARLTDRLEFDAGWRTPIISMLLALLFHRRHRRRLRLLRRGATPG